jgi:hypothetical protein
MPTINNAIPEFFERSAGNKNTQAPRRIHPTLKINAEYLKIRFLILNKISVSLNML